MLQEQLRTMGVDIFDRRGTWQVLTLTSTLARTLTLTLARTLSPDP